MIIEKDKALIDTITTEPTVDARKYTRREATQEAVDLLLAKVDIGQKRVVPYEEIALALGLPSGSTPKNTKRMRTLIDAWRKDLMRHYSIDTACVACVGVEILNARQRLDAGVRDFRTAVRKVRKARVRTAAVPFVELTPHEQQAHTHALAMMSKADQVISTDHDELRAKVRHALGMGK